MQLRRAKQASPLTCPTGPDRYVRADPGQGRQTAIGRWVVPCCRCPQQQLGAVSAKGGHVNQHEQPSTTAPPPPLSHHSCPTTPAPRLQLLFPAFNCPPAFTPFAAVSLVCASTLPPIECDVAFPYYAPPSSKATARDGVFDLDHESANLGLLVLGRHLLSYV